MAARMGGNIGALNKSQNGFKKKSMISGVKHPDHKATPRSPVDILDEDDLDESVDNLDPLGRFLRNGGEAALVDTLDPILGSS